MFSDPKENKKKPNPNKPKVPRKQPPLPFKNLLKQILRRTPALAKQKKRHLKFQSLLRYDRHSRTNYNNPKFCFTHTNTRARSPFSLSFSLINL